jgi:hypothetical protein
LDFLVKNSIVFLLFFDQFFIEQGFLKIGGRARVCAGVLTSVLWLFCARVNIRVRTRVFAQVCVMNK